MKAYSLDLRQKIVDTYLESGISQRQLAARFCLTLSFIEKLLKHLASEVKCLTFALVIP